MSTAEIRKRAKRCLAETVYPVGAWDTSQAAAVDVLALVEVVEAAQALVDADAAWLEEPLMSPRVYDLRSAADAASARLAEALKPFAP